MAISLFPHISESTSTAWLAIMSTHAQVGTADKGMCLYQVFVGAVDRREGTDKPWVDGERRRSRVVVPWRYVRPDSWRSGRNEVAGVSGEGGPDKRGRGLT